MAEGKFRCCPRTEPQQADLWAAFLGQIRLAGIVVWPLFEPTFQRGRATARPLLGHREGERSEKDHGENGGKSVSRY